MAPKIDRIMMAVAIGGLALLVCTAGYLGSPLPGSQALAQEASSGAESGEAEQGVEQTTEVGGEIPREFLGRWVAFPHVKLPSGLVRHFARLWEIQEGDEHFELIMHAANVPMEVNKKLDDATAAGEAWEPSPDDIQQVREQWDELIQHRGRQGKIENKLLAADSFPPEFLRDVVTKGSEYALVFNEVFGGGQSISRTYSIFSVRNREPERMTGTFITTSMARAPFPIPITLKGDFEMYRLEGPPPPSLIDRVFGVFSGCGGS